jgi:hypothetical protein
MGKIEAGSYKRYRRKNSGILKDSIKILLPHKCPTNE